MGRVWDFLKNVLHKVSMLLNDHTNFVKIHPDWYCRALSLELSEKNVSSCSSFMEENFGRWEEEEEKLNLLAGLRNVSEIFCSSM